MSEEIKVEQGKKVDEIPSDKSKIGLGQVPGKPPKVEEVEGQSGTWRYVRCPYCGTLNYVWDNYGYWDWWRCWWCGGVFG